MENGILSVSGYFSVSLRNIYQKPCQHRTGTTKQVPSSFTLSPYTSPTLTYPLTSWTWSYGTPMTCRGVEVSVHVTSQKISRTGEKVLNPEEKSSESLHGSYPSPRLSHRGLLQHARSTISPHQSGSVWYQGMQAHTRCKEWSVQYLFWWCWYDNDPVSNILWKLYLSSVVSEIRWWMMEHNSWVA